MSPRLYHVSESPDIEAFEPRPSPQRYDGLVADVVFAISEEMLHLYLVPRDCPRVGYMAGADSREEDINSIPATSKAVLTLESAWRPALRGVTLYLYEFAAEQFELLDANAGYYVSRKSVRPVAVRRIDEPLLVLAGMGVAVVFVSDLWPVADWVQTTSLRFSCIRMANAGKAVRYH